MQVRVLHVEILDWGARVPEQALLAPLREVKDFEVMLPWLGGTSLSGDFQDAEFRVRRPSEQQAPDLVVELDVDKGGPGVYRKRKILGRLRRW